MEARAERRIKLAYYLAAGYGCWREEESGSGEKTEAGQADKEVGEVDAVEKRRRDGEWWRRHREWEERKAAEEKAEEKAEEVLGEELGDGQGLVLRFKGGEGQERRGPEEKVEEVMKGEDGVGQSLVLRIKG